MQDKKKKTLANNTYLEKKKVVGKLQLLIFTN